MDAETPTPGQGMTRHVGATHRLSRWARISLTSAVVVSLAGGVFYAAFYDALPERPPSAAYECANPPCFTGGPPPRLRDLPTVAAVPLYVLAVILALPGLAAGLWSLIRGRTTGARPLLLTFAGVVAVIAYQEFGAHLPIVCRTATALCEETREYGLGLTDRWHQFGHAAFGALPALAASILAWRKWGPPTGKGREHE